MSRTRVAIAFLACAVAFVQSPAELAGSEPRAGETQAGVAATTGTLVTTLRPIVAAENPRLFGDGVALSGTTAVVAAYGRVFVFVSEPTGWRLEAELVHPGISQNATVAIWDDTIVVGGCCPAAFVFTRTAGVWSLDATLTPLDGTAAESFGSATAVKGGTIAIGAWSRDRTSGNNGAVYVYVRSSATWEDMTETARLDGPGWYPAAFGGPVAISDDETAIFGRATGEYHAGGEVFVFVRPGAGWTNAVANLAAIVLTPSERSFNDGFGDDIAASGDTLAVVGNGSVYLFLKPANGWIDSTQTARLTAAAGGWLGCSVDMHGDLVVSGDCGYPSQIHLFRKPESGWVDMTGGTQVVAWDESESIGRSLVVSSTSLLAGASLSDMPGGEGNEGEVYALALDPSDPDLDGLPAAIDNCPEASNLHQEDLDADGIGNPCDPCTVPTAAAPEMIAYVPGPTTTNRFLSFSAGDVLASQAVRVVFENLPGGFASWNGAELWVGQPSCRWGVLPFGSRETGCQGENFAVAALECTPTCRSDWQRWGNIQVFHEGIVPGGSYRIEVVGCGCAGEPEPVATALELATVPRWGDVVGPRNPTCCGWAPPDGRVDIVTDAVAVLTTFARGQGSARTIQADLVPARVDFTINITDITAVLDAFRGLPFPFAPAIASPCG